MRRNVRFLSPDGRRVPRLEYRAVETLGGWLAYVNNLDAKQTRQIKLASRVKFRGVRNLTLENDLPQECTLPAG